MNRPGFALLFVLVVVAALQLLTLSTLALATHESIVVDTHERTARARRGAEAALRRLEKTRLPALDSMQVGQFLTTSAGSGVAITVSRHAWGLFEAVATAPAGRATVRRRLVLRKLDLARGLAEANDAMVAAGPVEARRANLYASLGWTCSLPAPPPRTGRALTVAAPRYAVGLPAAVVDSTHAVLPGGYAFAGVRWDEVSSIADVIAGPNIELTAADSLGSPLRPLIYAPSDLTITGGQGAGIILVEGNLTIMAGARFSGVLVVRGSAMLDDDVVLHGSMRVQGDGATFLNAATIDHSPCVVAEVLTGVPAANRYIVARRRFLPAF